MQGQLYTVWQQHPEGKIQPRNISCEAFTYLLYIYIYIEREHFQFFEISSLSLPPWLNFYLLKVPFEADCFTSIRKTVLPSKSFMLQGLNNSRLAWKLGRTPLTLSRPCEIQTAVPYRRRSK